MESIQFPRDQNFIHTMLLVGLVIGHLIIVIVIVCVVLISILMIILLFIKKVLSLKLDNS